MAEPKSEGSAPKVTCPCCCGKRKDYLQWEEYFMSLAFLSGMRSKDPRTQVGACIVNDEKRIVGLGYNGMPDRVSDDEMFWAHSSEHEDQLKTKTHYVCHAELNAVLNKIQADCKKCTMYVSLFPCNRCAQVIIQAGIRNIVYYSDKYSDKPETKAAKMLFNKAEVNYRPYHEGFRREVNINFESINETGGKKPVNETAKTTVQNGIKVNSFFERPYDNGAEGFRREVNINFESINETGGEKPVNETAKTTVQNGIKVNSFFERCLFLDL